MYLIAKTKESFTHVYIFLSQGTLNALNPGCANWSNGRWKLGNCENWGKKLKTEIRYRGRNNMFFSLSLHG